MVLLRARHRLVLAQTNNEGMSKIFYYMKILETGPARTDFYQA